MSYAPTQKPFPARFFSSSDMTNLHVPVIHRHRRTVSTGGGRAWSEAEEAYLVETREHKMPYKHIAAQLKKTELACRLHYHQLSFGAKARHSATSYRPSRHHSRSIHSPSSLKAQPPSFRHSPSQQRVLPAFSPPASPPEPTHPSKPSAVDISHKPILPKPVTSAYARASTSPPCSLRPVTDDLSGSDSRERYVDITRLDRFYDTHRLDFWSTIASEYGGNLSPAAVEDAWRRAHCIITPSNFPPTPKGSPQSSMAQSRPKILTTPFSAVSANTDPEKFTAVDVGSSAQSWKEPANQLPRRACPIDKTSYLPTLQRTGSMSVSSLLTVDKDVRSPGKEKDADEAMEVDTSNDSQREGSAKRESPPVRSPTTTAVSA